MIYFGVAAIQHFLQTFIYFFDWKVGIIYNGIRIYGKHSFKNLRTLVIYPYGKDIIPLIMLEKPLFDCILVNAWLKEVCRAALPITKTGSKLAIPRANTWVRPYISKVGAPPHPSRLITCLRAKFSMLSSSPEFRVIPLRSAIALIKKSAISGFFGSKGPCRQVPIRFL